MRDLAELFVDDAAVLGSAIVVSEDAQQTGDIGVQFLRRNGVAVVWGRGALLDEIRGSKSIRHGVERIKDRFESRTRWRVVVGASRAGSEKTKYPRVEEGYGWMMRTGSRSTFAKVGRYGSLRRAGVYPVTPETGRLQIIPVAET